MTCAIARRRFLLAASAAVAAAAVPIEAWSQAYPARPVRMIVPFAAGGSVDVIGRIIAQRLADRLGQQFYVENIPTGASNVGSALTAKAPPDGYTLLFVTSSFVINPSYYRKLNYDPIREFAPITLAAVSPHALAVNLAMPVKNVQDLIALVKANPGKYSYASAGAGQSAQLAAELFKLAYGLDIVHVPFNGGAPAMAATIGGHTDIAFNALPSAATFIKEGKLRALAVTSAKRDPEFPDVPTFAEVGVPNQESTFFVGLVAPAATPADIISKLNREIGLIMVEPGVRERMKFIGYAPSSDTPQEFASMLKSELERWAQVIRDSGMQKVE